MTTNPTPVSTKPAADMAVEREKFESIFPMPANCIWTGNGYAATDYNAWGAHGHKDKWDGWKARAALARPQEVAGVEKCKPKTAFTLADLNELINSEVCDEKTASWAAAIISKYAVLPWADHLWDAAMSSDEPTLAVFAQAVIDRVDAASRAPVAVGVEPIGDLELLRKTVEEFEECGETDTSYETLMAFAQRGFFECTHFVPTALAKRALDAGSFSAASEKREYWNDTPECAAARIVCGVDPAPSAGAGGSVGAEPVGEVLPGQATAILYDILPVGAKLYATPAPSVPLGGGEVPTHEQITKESEERWLRNKCCALCGRHEPHEHTPVDSTIYRNGIKRGLNNGTEPGPGAQYTGNAQDGGTDSSSVSGQGGPGADEHLQHRAGQSGLDGTEHQSDSGGSGLHGAGEVHSQTVDVAFPVVAWMTDDGRVATSETKLCMPRASKASFNEPLVKLSDAEAAANLSHPLQAQDAAPAQPWLGSWSIPEYCERQRKYDLALMRGVDPASFLGGWAAGYAYLAGSTVTFQPSAAGVQGDAARRYEFLRQDAGISDGRPFIAIMTEEHGVQVHMNGGLSDYATPCGLALDGDEFSGRVAELPAKPKVTCPRCKELFDITENFKRSDFQKGNHS